MADDEDVPTHVIRRKRILLVDDDPGVHQMVGRELAGAGYDVVSLGDADEALAWMGLESPDLAILDVAMPGLSGLELCRVIRQHERTRDVPVIFLTGKRDLRDFVEGEAAGSDLYLTKPVLASRLKSMVGLFLSSEGALKKAPRQAS